MTIKSLGLLVFLQILILSVTFFAQNQPEDTTQQLNYITQQREQAELEYYQTQTNKLKEFSFWNDKTITGIFTLSGVVLGLLISYFLNKRRDTTAKKKIYEKQRDAVVLTTIEFLNCLIPIIEYWKETNAPPPFMNTNLVFEQPVGPRINDANEPFYQKYLLVQVVYLLSSMLGWLELYRQDLHFLEIKRNSKIELIIDKIRIDLSNSFLTPNSLKNSRQEFMKNDSIILDEEQRAIGEKMLVPLRDQMVIMGYATFCEKLFKLPVRSFDYREFTPNDKDQDFWIYIATGFLSANLMADLVRQERGKNDFRLQRLTFLATHLVELLQHLKGKKYVQEKKFNHKTLLELQSEWKKLIKDKIKLFDQNGFNDMAKQMDNLLEGNLEELRNKKF